MGLFRFSHGYKSTTFSYVNNYVCPSFDRTLFCCISPVFVLSATNQKETSTSDLDKCSGGFSSERRRTANRKFFVWDWTREPVKILSIIHTNMIKSNFIREKSIIWLKISLLSKILNHLHSTKCSMKSRLYSVWDKGWVKAYMFSSVIIRPCSSGRARRVDPDPDPIGWGSGPINFRYDEL